MSSPQLEVVKASEEQKKTAFRQVFDVWPCGATIEEHLQWRLHSVQHQRAAWYVGLHEGQVACSLGAYPLRLQLDQTTRPAFAIGAVHTANEFRGRGFAARLIRAVEQSQQQQGAQLAVLFSDIPPEYYGRLGYVACDSHELHAPAAPVSSDVELRARDDWTTEEVDAAYRASLADNSLWIERDAEYWDFLARRDRARSQRWEVWWRKQRLGYVQTACAASSKKLHLVDYAAAGIAADSINLFWEDLTRALANLAYEQRMESIAGWAPRVDSLATCERLRPRAEEITMVKTLVDELALTTAHRQACDHLREIDHV